MKHKFFLVVLVLGLGIGGVQAQQHRLEQEPGYVDLSSVAGWFDTEPSREVNIRGALLRLVAEASRYEDPELSRMLFKLKAIQVRGFPLRSSQFESISRRTADITRQLESQGWDTVVRVRDRHEHVDMFVKVQGEAIAGMVVMVVEPGDDETVFVNIVGDIDPEQIGRLGHKFNFGDVEWRR